MLPPTPATASTLPEGEYSAASKTPTCSAALVSAGPGPPDASASALAIRLARLLVSYSR
jgi:hypothetical protein